MANKKPLLIAALAAFVLLVLFLFTRDTAPPVGKRPQPQANQGQAMPKPAAGQAKVAKPRQVKAKKVVRINRKANRRAAFLKRWEKMTPQQREAFKKAHPKAKIPADTPATPQRKAQ